MLITLLTFTSLINVQMSVQNLIQITETNLSGSKFPSNHLKLERSPGVMIFTHACGTVTAAQVSRGRCRYDPHFPLMYMFITRSLFSCCWYSGKFRSNMGADVSTIKKHLQQPHKIFHSSKAEATQSTALRMLCTLCTLYLQHSLHQVATLAAICTRQPRKVTDFFFYHHLYKMLAGRLPWESDDSDVEVLLLYTVGNKRERN